MREQEGIPDEHIEALVRIFNASLELSADLDEIDLGAMSGYKDKLLAVGDEHESQIAADRAADAAYR